MSVQCITDNDTLTGAQSADESEYAGVRHAHMERRAAVCRVTPPSRDQRLTTKWVKVDKPIETLLQKFSNKT